MCSISGKARDLEKASWDDLAHAHHMAYEQATLIRNLILARREAPELTDEIYKQIEAFQDASADAIDAENKGRTVALKALTPS